MKDVLKPAIYLFIIAAVGTSILLVVHAVTLEPIQTQIRQTQERLMQAVLPQADEFNEIQASLSGSMVGVIEAKSQGERIGFIVSLAPMGYAGPIEMLIGISSEDGAVAGMRVVRHSETPGFGSVITHERFYREFDDRPLNPITVVRSGAGAYEIDSIAASTITTVAVVVGFNDAVEWYRGGAN